MPRFAWPSWRWMTLSGTPSRAISTACAWRGLERTLAAGLGVRPLAKARRAKAITAIWR